MGAGSVTPLDRRPGHGHAARPRRDDGLPAPAWGEGESAPQRMLTLVRLGRPEDQRVLECALAIQTEHQAQLVVLAVWNPTWWQCVGFAGPQCAGACAWCARDSAALWVRERCAGCGAQVRLRSVCHVPTLLRRELTPGRYTQLVASARAVSSAQARRLIDRAPSLRIVRI